jgi:L-ascorbate metabolism protein UlaG (beta-lactamase superfamily)
MNMAKKKILKAGRTISKLILVVIAFIALYLELPMFGQLPRGRRLERIEKSPNYHGGRFRNRSDTSIMSGNPLAVAARFIWNCRRFFVEDRRKSPRCRLPVVRTDLKSLNPQEDLLVWFGHSSCLIQLHGKRILVDPLFSKVSSPILFFPKAFDGTDLYQADDMPEIDHLIITHDHWDHLDYKAILRLKPKVKNIVCPLGVGAHLEYWGFDKEKIIEMDWEDSVLPAEGFRIHCLPARHFSGRGIFRNRSLWASFLLETKTFKIYIGGDGGYDKHFKEIGNKFGPIDLAILDSGQHDKNWRYIHMMTDEVMKAANDLGAKMLLPVHIGKISLANHPWNEPLVELSRMPQGPLLLTPKIGEKVNLRSSGNTTTRWWEDLE